MKVTAQIWQILIVVLLFCAVIFVFFNSIWIGDGTGFRQQLSTLRLNELGDFSAGLFAPLAFLGILISLFYQIQATRDSSKQFRLLQRQQIIAELDREVAKIRKFMTAIADFEVSFDFNDRAGMRKDTWFKPFQIDGVDKNTPLPNFLSRFRTSIRDFYSAEVIPKISVISGYRGKPTLSDGHAHTQTLLKMIRNLEKYSKFKDLDVEVDFAEFGNLRQDLETAAARMNALIQKVQQ